MLQVFGPKTLLATVRQPLAFFHRPWPVTRGDRHIADPGDGGERLDTVGSAEPGQQRELALEEGTRCGKVALPEIAEREVATGSGSRRALGTELARDYTQPLRPQLGRAREIAQFLEKRRRIRQSFEQLRRALTERLPARLNRATKPTPGFGPITSGQT